MANSSVFIAAQGSVNNSEFERYRVPQKRYLVNEFTLDTNDVEVQWNGFSFTGDITIIGTVPSIVTNVPIFGSAETTTIPAGTQFLDNQFTAGHDATRDVNIYFSQNHTDSHFILGTFARAVVSPWDTREAGGHSEMTIPSDNNWIFLPWGVTGGGAFSTRTRINGGSASGAFGTSTYYYDIIPVALL